MPVRCAEVALREETEVGGVALPIPGLGVDPSIAPADFLDMGTDPIEVVG
jgi:hypothetical protein